MDKNIFEEGPRRGHAAGDTSLEQQASQLASDIRYKARQKMKGKSGSNLSPGQVQQLYRQLLNSSPASGGVKAIVKKKLFGEQIDYDSMKTLEISSDLKSNVFAKIFEEDDAKFVVKVIDKATGNTSYRKADRAKIAELRANKNISSVEITGRKEVDDAFKGDPKPNYGGKKAKRDYDGDGKVESGSKEHAGVVHNAIQRKKGGVADGQDTRKEEVIYEKEDKGGKKLDVMKGKNAVKINPTIGESIRAELDALKSQRVEEAAASAAKAVPTPEERKKLQAKDQMLKKKIMLQKQTMQMQKQGRLPLNYSESCDTCEKCGKSPCECPKKEGEVKAMDPREVPTRINLAKNKLRAMGLKMSYDMEGDQIDERTRYAKETGKDPQTGKPSVKGGQKPDPAFAKVSAELRKTGGMMSSRRQPIQPQGKKKVPGAKGPKGVTPVDRIKGQLARKRAPKPDMGSRFD